jgi:hypothetical protein
LITIPETLTPKTECDMNSRARLAVCTVGMIVIATQNSASAGAKVLMEECFDAQGTLCISPFSGSCPSQSEQNDACGTFLANEFPWFDLQKCVGCATGCQKVGGEHECAVEQGKTHGMACAGASKAAGGCPVS